MIDDKIKEILENNPVALSTVTSDNKPNVIAVAAVKSIEDNRVLISDGYMHETIDNIKENHNVCLAVWNQKWEGYKIIGTASYFNEGQWLERVKKIPENKDIPVKGAIVVDVNKIIKLG